MPVILEPIPRFLEAAFPLVSHLRCESYAEMLVK